MAENSGSCGIYRRVCLVFLMLVRLTAAQNDTVAASTGKVMELSAPFIAITKASAEAPSAGSGPAISNVTRNPTPQPEEGQDIQITAVVAQPVATMTLSYIVNYGTEQSVPMTAEINGQYSASIPASAFNASSMVRWYVMALGLDQQISRSPPRGEADQYFGTIIADPTMKFNLPVMEWYTNEVADSMTKSGANKSSVYFLGRFYDNVFVRRKGVTSLSWPKPKLKFKMHRREFVYKQELNKTAKEHKVKAFDLNSLYYEPGQKSYMREAIAYQVLQDAGGVSALSFHIILRLNGEFYGLYTYVENDDKEYLERNGLSQEGILIKPTNGNLGFSVPLELLQYSYEQKSHETSSYWSYLHSFTQGIAGGGDKLRSNFVFDYVELSETINTMAVLTMLLTQDRCTKNYLLYLDLNTSKWQMFAYDLKSALNADAGYKGKPALDYCTLECSQWNSPLFCDRNHPQDVQTISTSPWTFISASSIGRRMQQQQPMLAIPDNGPNGKNVNITDPNQNLIAAGKEPTGAAGTFNYLIDLITQVPNTRAMYMRRLRTLTDQYYATGKIATMVTNMYNLIHEAADIDDQKWHIGNITLGYLQLIEEQIPTRKTQLLSTYGPAGVPALLPDAQPSQVFLEFGRFDCTSSPDQQYVEVVNSNAFAVDVSGWQISGGATVTIKPGTVIASGNSLIISTSPAGFKQRTTPPMMGQGMQVIGKLEGSPCSVDGYHLLDGSGVVVASSKQPSPATVAG